MLFSGLLIFTVAQWAFSVFAIFFLNFGAIQGISHGFGESCWTRLQQVRVIIFLLVDFSLYELTLGGGSVFLLFSGLWIFSLAQWAFVVRYQLIIFSMVWVDFIIKK